MDVTNPHIFVQCVNLFDFDTGIHIIQAKSGVHLLCIKQARTFWLLISNDEFVWWVFKIMFKITSIIVHRKSYMLIIYTNS